MIESKSPIPKWAVDDRPREKLLKRGIRSMTNAELIAILFRSGNRETSAVQLAQNILKTSENKLSKLSKLSAQELMTNKGVGEAKALSLIAAMELGRRRRAERQEERTAITSSQSAFDVLHALIGDADYEEFWILVLNRKNEVIRKEQVSDGGMSQTVVDSKRVFKKALEYRASSIIIAHNHPSGNLKPSQEDIILTKKLVAAGKLLDIPVVDHLIVTDGGYFSFADKGML